MTSTGARAGHGASSKTAPRVGVTERTRGAANGVLWLGTQLLGAGLVVFSLPAIVAPGRFGRLFGLPVSGHPAESVVYRSISVRDVVMGIGLISAARHFGRLAPWLLIRALCDGGDALAIGWAFLRGAGNRRLGALGLMALGAALYDAALYVIAKREG